MNSPIFDTAARHVAARLPRRETLIGLGAVLAALAAPFPAGAKKRKKKAKDLCKRQEGQCESSAAAICATSEFPEACLNGMLPCCTFFRTCDATAAFECLLAPLV